MGGCAALPVSDYHRRISGFRKPAHESLHRRVTARRLRQDVQLVPSRRRQQVVRGGGARGQEEGAQGEGEGEEGAMRHAVYSGSRNLYPDMVTAAKSLVANSSVGKVHFLIEDDDFPYDLPDIIETANVSGQGWFPPSCANMTTHFTYMSLLRVCYSKMFPDVREILQLDVDTVCVGDVDAIWDADLDGRWFAMVPEHLGSYKPFGPVYYNCGVALFNLDQIRADGADDRAIQLLNSVKVPYIDQDAWNRLARRGGKSVDLPVRYNECFVTGFTDDPAIVHFAGARDWQDSTRKARREYLRKYREMTWEQVMEMHSDRG